MPKSYGTIIDFYKDIAPNNGYTNEELLFIDKLKSIFDLLNKTFGDNNVIITGSLAMFLQEIRLYNYNINSDIEILLINDIDNNYDKYTNLISDNININIKLNVLPQVFQRHFFSIKEYTFHNTQIFIETPESLLIDKVRNLEENIVDIQIIKTQISNKNDYECINLINALNAIFGNLNIQYAITGSYSLWMQGIELQREFGHDIDIILMCDINDDIINNVIDNKKIKHKLYDYKINKDIDFIIKRNNIDDDNYKINFKGYDVYVTGVPGFIQTKLRYCREQRSKNNVIKSQFDLLCLSNLGYKELIQYYDILGSFNDINNKINNFNITNDLDFYNNIQTQLNIISNDLSKKCHETYLHINK